jgi:G3E family GTPase
VAQTVLDPGLRGLFELDALLGVADARHLERTLDENPEGAVQLAYVSAVVLNEADLASPPSAPQLAAARKLVGRLNPRR